MKDPEPLPPNHETVLVMRGLKADTALMTQAAAIAGVAELRSLCRDNLTLSDPTLFFAEWVWLRGWIEREKAKAALSGATEESTR